MDNESSHLICTRTKWTLKTSSLFLVSSRGEKSETSPSLLQYEEFEKLVSLVTRDLLDDLGLSYGDTHHDSVSVEFGVRYQNPSTSGLVHVVRELIGSLVIEPVKLGLSKRGDIKKVFQFTWNQGGCTWIRLKFGPDDRVE